MRQGRSAYGKPARLARGTQICAVQIRIGGAAARVEQTVCAFSALELGPSRAGPRIKLQRPTLKNVNTPRKALWRSHVDSAKHPPLLALAKIYFKRLGPPEVAVGPHIKVLQLCMESRVRQARLDQGSVMR